MSFQAYLDSVKAKTGKTPADFAKLAGQKGLTRHGELVGWLKSEFALGHGHATAIAGVVLKSGKPPRSATQKMDGLFAGDQGHTIGPSFIKIGKAVLYPLEELDRWDRRNLVVCRPYDRSPWRKRRSDRCRAGS